MQPLEVLHLEDSKLDAELTARHLSNNGLHCHIQRVDSREGFVKALSTKNYDLILADYSLPEFDGELALEIVREMSLDTPFIFVSGMLGEEIAIDSLRHGATDYVLKHRLDRLSPAVRRALAEQAARRERLAVENALRESEFRYRLLVDSVNEYALFTTDGESRVTLWNTGAERIFGYAEAEAVGKFTRELIAEDFLLPRSGAGLPENSAEVRRQFEGWLVRRDGTRFWASGTCSAMRGPQDGVYGFVTVVRDNTDRRKAEEERSALLEREQAARAEAERRAAEMAEVNAALSRSNAELEQFAYAASHDLQEPLRMVKSFTQLLAIRWKNQIDDRTAEILKFIEFGSERMQNLVDDLLSYSRVLHDRETNQETVNLGSVLDRTLLLFKEQIEREGAVVERTALPDVTANAERIGLVLQNLLSNALKYRNDRPPVIKVSAVAAERDYIIEVADNGIGFDPQYSDRIFGLFKRLHRSDEYPGTGVGLALCKQIVEQHGGRIWAESALGNGTKLSFTLPRANSN